MSDDQTHPHPTTIEVPFAREELDALDSWIGRQPQDGLTREDAIKRLVRSAMAVDAEWERAKRSARRDEGLRPQELTAENDG